MKLKTLIGGLIAGVVSFLLGWLVFGILLHNYYEANSVQYPGLNWAQPRMWALIIANLSWGFLLAYILDLSGANSIMKGFTIGFVVFLLATLGIDMFSLAFMHLMRIRLALVDTATNAVFGGLIGAIVGWWYSRSSDKATT
jgi:hypothetical protein